MEVSTAALRGTAQTFLKLGIALSESEGSAEATTLGEELFETGDRFRRIADTLDPDDYMPDQRQMLYQNFYNLERITQACAERARRTTPLLENAGRVADELQIGDECRKIAEVLKQVVVKLHEASGV